MPAAVPIPNIATLPSRPTAKIEALWDDVAGFGDGGFGDGLFDETEGEGDWFDLTPYVISTVSVKPGGFEPEHDEPIAGEFVCTLRNDSGIFSPANPDSALSANVDADRPVRVTFRYAGAEYCKFYGTIERIEPTIEHRRSRVHLTCVDDTWRLAEAAALGRDWTGWNLYDIINALLDDARWPADMRDIDVPADTAPYFEVPPGDKVSDCLGRIAKGELGRFYLRPTKTGPVFVYESRHYRRQRPRCINVQGAILDAFTVITPEQTQRNTITGVIVTATPKRPGAPQVVWEDLAGGVEIAANDSEDVWAEPGTYSTGLEQSAGAVIAYAYMKALFTDGSGPATVTWSTPVFYGGRRALVTVTNANDKPVRVYAMRIIGTPVSPIEDFVLLSDPLQPKMARPAKISATYEDSEGFGHNDNLEHPYATSLPMIQGYAKAYVEKFVDQRPKPTIDLVATTPTRIAMLLNAHISHRYRVAATLLDMDDEFWLEEMSFTFGDAHLLAATWRLNEALDPLDVYEFGTAEFETAAFVEF